MRDLDAEIEARFYPGSRHEIPDRRPEPKPPREPTDWDDSPLVFNGQEFFTIGQLALAIDRSPVTMRAWERDGILPKARFRTANRSPKKAKRLYTRAQCEGIIRIAQEEGLMAPAKAGGLRRAPIPLSFVHRVRDLFKALEETP